MILGKAISTFFAFILDNNIKNNNNNNRSKQTDVIVIRRTI